MIAREDATILLEGLNYLTANPTVKTWRGTSRGTFLGSLAEIFLTDDVEKIRIDLEAISVGQISSTTVPQDVLERAENQGINKENLEVRVQEQRSQVKYWVNRLKQTSSQKAKEVEIKNNEVGSTKSTPEAKKETVINKKNEKIIYQQESKDSTTKETLVKETPLTEEVVIPVTGSDEIQKEIPADQKLENIQIKFDVKEIGSIEERLEATTPFLAASAKTAQSEFIDLNPSLNLISKGISSEQLRTASSSLPESPEKQSLFRISYTMNEIERIFPNEISRFRNLVSIENLEISVSNTDFIPSQNNILLRPNVNSFGGYTSFDGSSEISSITDLVKNQTLDKASDTILSKVKSDLGGKLAKTSLGKAVTSLGSKLSSTALGKALSAMGAKIGAALGSFAPIIGNIIGAIAGAIAGWVMEKLLPLIQKIKDGAKKAAKGIAATALTLVMLPFIMFFSSIALPFLIVLIALPISVAIIMFIINSGAFIVPPKSIPNSELVSPYIDVVKTANPSGPFQNGDIPIEIEYTVEIKAKKSTLSNIRINDDCTVVKKGTPPSCPTTSPSIPSGIEIPETISPNTPFSFTYKRSFTSSSFKDTLTIDTVTITANAPEKQNAEAATSASIKIGKPPEECPNNSWPIAGNGGLRSITQGPFCSRYSHALMRAEAIDIGVNGASAVAVNSGIAKVAVDDCYGKYVDIKSSCGNTVFISRYAHLGAVTISNGQTVTLGQTIGITDNTGSCTTGPHLHFDFRSESGGRVSPPTMSKPYLIRDIPSGCCTLAECN